MNGSGVCNGDLPITAWGPNGRPRRGALVAFGLEECAEGVFTDADVLGSIEAESLATVLCDDQGWGSEGIA